MRSPKHSLGPPIVHLVGDVEHPDFRDASPLVRSQSQVANDGAAVELIIVAQSRPDAISEQQVRRLRRTAPLAGIVGLLGSWCEGETRTGRPWPGVPRLYWYEFPSWWRRQLELRAAGRCPDWARPGDFGLRLADRGSRISEIHGPASNWSKRVAWGDTQHPASSIEHPAAGILHPTYGVIVLRVWPRDTAHALADTFRRTGFATVWQRPGRPDCVVRGATAGIWDGGHLSEREARDLALFCRSLTSDAAPVIALLDFPRRDRVDLAFELGATAVLGKPWRNDALLAQLHALLRTPAAASAA